MPKKKTKKTKNWIVCYECDEWHTKKSIDKLEHCPRCGNKLIEVCGKCKKPIDNCSCKKAS
jgi:uncharacterized paraquat-inducible protein A